MRRQAQCLREHGVEAGDPTPESPDISFGESTDYEKTGKAMEECGMGGGVQAVPVEVPK